jgi:hypothetical protein
MPLQRLPTCVLITACICLAGCEPKFNHRNFQMIQPGVDDRADVRHILGDPDAEMGEVWMYDDLDKEWMDAKTGNWEGDDPWADKPPEGEVRESTTKTRRIDDD